jgi:hypothetical protein
MRALLASSFWYVTAVDAVACTMESLGMPLIGESATRTIASNTDLLSIAAAGCTSIDYFRLQKCGDCTQSAFASAMTGLTSISAKDTDIGYSFYLAHSGRINSLVPCSNIAGSLTGAFQLINMSNITSFEGLSGLSDIGISRFGMNSIELYDNLYLETAENLTASFAGRLKVVNNPRLCDMDPSWASGVYHGLVAGEDCCGNSLPAFPEFCSNSTTTITPTTPSVPTDSIDDGGGDILTNAVSGNPMALGLLTVFFLLVVSVPMFFLKAYHLLSEMQSADPYNTKNKSRSDTGASARVSWSHSSSMKNFGEYDVETNPTGLNPMQQGNRGKIQEFSTPEAPHTDTGHVVLLPDGWEPFIDDASGQYYYYFAETGETTWEHPGVAA